MSRTIDSTFSAHKVRQELQEAVVVVRKSLDATRNPQHPEEVAHTYDDKYRIVELATRAAVATQLNTLADGFGVTPEVIQRLQETRGNKTVTLRVNARTSCAFRETKTREEKSATRLEKKGVFGKTTYESVTTITEHYWDYSTDWEVLVYVGSNSDESQGAIRTCGRSGKHTILTRGKTPSNPQQPERKFDPIDVEITWLLDACKGGPVDFAVDRSDPKTCHTPRRNEQVEQMLRNGAALTRFCNAVRRQVERVYRDGYSNHLPAGEESPNFGVINDNVFVPVTVMIALTAREGVDGGGADASPAETFSPEDFATILKQQQDELRAKFDQIAEVIPDTGIVTPTEANVVVCSGYTVTVWAQYGRAVQAVEDMLMNQVIAAIGKRVGPDDFAKYMTYHNRQLYRPEFAPRGFCYAVRRPNHYPEGTLSLEDVDNQPVPTTCLHRPQGHPMKFTLSAAVEVDFEGEHYVHSVVFHKFSTSPSPKLTLIARARQFSSFILMVGTLSSANTFDPKHALIIQNKDELMIPLLLETIPAPQEFRDAIESLSPEQQAFCKAYRKMQLAGTLFAVAVVQIKPQLERLLNLPHDALTKEVQMCQDLMSLFIEYQIPSDLMAYAGPENASPDRKLQAVKGFVANIQAMLTKAKEEEIEEEKRKYQKQHPVPPPPGGGAYSSAAPSFNDSFDMFAAPTQSLANSYGSAPMLRGGMALERAAAMPMPTCAPVAMMAPGMPPPPPAAAGGPSQPQLQQQQQQQQQSQQPQKQPQDQQPQPVDAQRESVQDSGAGASSVDYTQLPTKLDKNFDKFDKFNALRATTIKLGPSWSKTSQKGLLSKPTTTSLYEDSQRDERSRAFDLLDALSKSGALPLQGCTLHVVVAATHCFDLDLMNTVVQDNINPIERVEGSGLIMASTIFDAPAQSLVQDSHVARIADAELSTTDIVVSS